MSWTDCMKSIDNELDRLYDLKKKGEIERMDDIDLYIDFI